MINRSCSTCGIRRIAHIITHPLQSNSVGHIREKGRIGLYLRHNEHI